MSVKNISSAILGVGVDDTTIDLFESQYPVPTGVSYNSYVIRDEKIAILDTVDDRATDELSLIHICPRFERILVSGNKRGRRKHTWKRRSRSKTC